MLTPMYLYSYKISQHFTRKDRFPILHMAHLELDFFFLPYSYSTTTIPYPLDVDFFFLGLIQCHFKCPFFTFPSIFV